jgi:hypothetical protein
MASVSMTVKVEKDVTEGLLKDIPIGYHKVTFPLDKLTFTDYTRGVWTLGGPFTKENITQIIVNNAEEDSVTFDNILINGD